MQTNPTTSRRKTKDPERLNVLMEAIALIIARRQMRSHWARAGHRAISPSII